MAPHDKGSYFSDPHRLRIWEVSTSTPISGKIRVASNLAALSTGTAAMSATATSTST